jgi:hypothetical protein
MWFRHKPRQFIEEYYLPLTTTFEISFSCGSNTNHDSLLKNTTYTGPPRLRYLFHVVQTQTTTVYCRILPTLDHHVWDIFFMWFRQNYDSLLKNTTYTGPPRFRYLFYVVQTQTTAAYYSHRITTWKYIVHSSDYSGTNHSSLSSHTTYASHRRLRYCILTISWKLFCQDEDSENTNPKTKLGRKFLNKLPLPESIMKSKAGKWFN